VPVLVLLLDTSSVTACVILLAALALEWPTVRLFFRKTLNLDSLYDD
jgi:hypothetical protein